MGVVAKVYANGDLRVNVDGKTWTFSPACVVPIATGTVNYDDKHSRNSIFGHEPHHGMHTRLFPVYNYSSYLGLYLFNFIYIYPCFDLQFECLVFSRNKVPQKKKYSILNHLYWCSVREFFITDFVWIYCC